MINLYNQKEIEILKEGGRILALILDELKKETKEGIKGRELEEKARKLIKKYGASPSFLGYKKFPKALCLSLNEELVHGLPGEQIIKKGDLVKLDLGIRYKGLHLDKAISFLVKEKDKEKEKFIKTVKKALNLGIKKAKIGNHLGSLSEAIQKTIEKKGYGLVTALSGHGVGRKVHEEPKVPNSGKKDEGPVLKEGMVLAIEPMACLGSGKIEVKKDGFTVVCQDGSLACHFEETIAITKKGPLILTRS